MSIRSQKQEHLASRTLQWYIMLHATRLTLTLEHQVDIYIFFCQFYFGNKALSMTAMEGVEGVPVLFVAWNQPDVFRLGSGFKFQTLVRNCLECERKYGIR